MRPRIVLLLAIALLVSGRVCAQAPILDEDGSYLMPQSATLYTGRSLQLHARYVGCADRAQKICNVVLSEREVIEWRVNGIPGGSEGVGTVTGGSTATYTAPRSVPPGNPVSVSAIVKGNGREQLQLVSEIRIVEPSKWQGSVSYTFTGLLDANAHDQAQVAHLDQVWAWLTPEHDTAGSDVTKVSLSVQYLVRGVMVDSVAQDMSGMVVLELGMPTAVFGYHRRAIDGCGGSTVTRRLTSPSLEVTRMVVLPGRLPTRTKVDDGAKPSRPAKSRRARAAGSTSAIDGSSLTARARLLERILSTTWYRRAPQYLIDLANSRGGDDNITVVCVCIANDAG